MRKFCGVACTVGFGLFWICGGLVALAVVTGGTVEAPLVALAGIGGLIGLASRLRVVQETRHLPVGARATNGDSAAA
jgi:hypothetical protein